MKQAELLTTQSNANPQDNSDSSNDKPIWERYQIPDSPFWVIGNEEKGYHIIMGKYKLTREPLKMPQFTPNEKSILDEADAWLENNKWDVILSIAICAATDLINNKTN